MARFGPDTLLPVLAALPPTPRLWIAYSGGLDSHCLLHACASLGTRLPVSLGAIHLDHGLHPLAPVWSEHCRQVCAALGVPYAQRHLKLQRRPGASLEALARSARRRALATLLGPAELVATAQHRDDQAETLLLALLRGGGVHGLASMPAIMPLGAGFLVRPLLGFDRADLRDYAARHALTWVEDPSNADTGFDRNYLRGRVMPLLRARWPAAAATLARGARHCADAAALIDEAAEALLPALAGSRPGTLSVAALLALPDPKRRIALRRWVGALGFLTPSADRLGRVVDEVLCARGDAEPLVAWRGCEIRRYRDDVFALSPLPPRPDETILPWPGGAALQLPGGLGELHWRPPDLGSRALAPRIVGFGLQGLRCRDSAGHRRRLKQLFQAAGVPGWLRPYVPLVLEAGALRAVAGVSGCGPDAPAAHWSGHPWQGFGIFTG